MRSHFDLLKQSRSELIDRFLSGEITDSFSETYTGIIDRYFQDSIPESDAGKQLYRAKIPFAFVAVGGYGRKDLCVHSDIDILILFRSDIPPIAKKLSEEIFFPLWDLGLDLGNGIRTEKDCLKLAQNDFEVLTSLLDARFLYGDTRLFDDFKKTFFKKIVEKKSMSIVKWLEQRNIIRMETFGDASHLLEPNLKNGMGSLRDYHHILWLGKIFPGLLNSNNHPFGLSETEHNRLNDSINLIMQVRNHLHEISGRKNDRLHFEYQEIIAERLGFAEKQGLLAVEHFLGKLHGAMTAVKIFSHSIAAAVIRDKRKRNDVSEIDFKSGIDSTRTPSDAMGIFVLSSNTGKPLSLDARRLVRDHLDDINENFRHSSDAFNSLLQILNGPYAFETLDQMYETGFLDRFIPELGPIKDLVQFDAYHIFPVGIHVLETVSNLKKLKNKNEMILTDIMMELESPETLYLAALFHDIGKTEKDHSMKGVEITQKILNRFNYDEDRTKDILFLIQHHLFLAETATRRDLNDEKLVVQSARLIGDIERLKMLYLLTWADSMATGPKAWNDWTANLVQEFFIKILHILEQKELATPAISRQVEDKKSHLRQLILNNGNEKDVDSFFDAISPRYTINTCINDIVLHFSMFLEYKKQPRNPGVAPFMLNTKKNESESCWEMTFLGKDSQGLFSRLAGVLSLNNINVLSANIYTWEDGTVLDIFQITAPLDTINPERIWKKIETDLSSILAGKISLSYRLSEKAAPSIISNNNKPSRPPRIVVNNKASDFFTLIEVFADDRPNILYTITHTLAELRLDIHISKIATKGDQVADIFYVRDCWGQKVESDEQITEIQKALHYHLL